MSQKVIRFTQQEAQALEEVERVGGRVLHEFTPSVFVAEFPDNTDLTMLTASTAEPPVALDEISHMAAVAWTVERVAKQQRLSMRGADRGLGVESLPWDTPGRDAPYQHVSRESIPGDSMKLRTRRVTSGTPTSLYLIGSVAVGVILVSRDEGDENLSESEAVKVLQEVQEGLDWLVQAEPRARLSFVYDIHRLTVQTEPGPYAAEVEPFERMESGWRDAALGAMGYKAGRAGYRKYVNDLRANKDTDWAYAAFFTKYPLNHFAYAAYEKIVMHYANDNWGPDEIGKVFAHETCHIFGAKDEYGNCSCGGAHGYLREPNDNCRRCLPSGAQEQCLMNSNTLQMCRYSRRQLGWDTSLFP
jgi:hypothetical protein